ncbi:MAG TPA: aminotransferase class III-fold pyridoxal phosphate-dependent enzyme [Gemmatimonadales bacterium]
MTEAGLRADEVVRLEDLHGSGGVGRRPVTIVRGDGARLFDDAGHEYLDLASAHGWANLGHGHPEILEAIHAQTDRLIAHTESSYNDQRAAWFGELAAVLREAFGENDHGVLSRISPSNSGTEAVEAALKFARVSTGRSGVVAFTRAFHGRTFGALSATATARYRAPFEPLVPGFTHVPLNDLAALDGAISDTTAAVLVEIVQGEGGVHEAQADFVAGAQRLCRERGALFIVDEIQTGFGRTGRWFASQWVDAKPDIVTLGKALGGGIPMGAAVWRDRLGGFEVGAHGSTFGGNPLACAASRAMLRVLRRDDLPARADRLGARLLGRLRTSGAPGVREVRGRGLMIGIELKQAATPVLKALTARGVWALPAGRTVLRLMPPLTIDEPDLDRAGDILLEILHDG